MVRRHKGFTLIELLAVIAIIGILAALAAIAISSATKRARDAQRKRDLANVKTALELYAQDEGAYPTPTGNAIPPVLKTDGYIKEIPTPPNTKVGTYYYDTDGTGSFILRTNLEYAGEKKTLDGVTCGDSYTKSGNGSIPKSGATLPCFRVTSD